MLPFNELNKAVQKKIQQITKDVTRAYYSDIPCDEFWNLYLDSFPEGTNPIFRERREFDCNCCKQFVTTIGRMIILKNGKRHTIWEDLDLPEGDRFKIVADILSARLKAGGIESIFVTDRKRIGIPTTPDKDTDIIWEHFWVDVPEFLVVDKDFLSSLPGQCASELKVFKRALDEIKKEALETVTDLINTNSIFRGNTYHNLVQAFFSFSKDYHALSEHERHSYLLEHIPYSFKYGENSKAVINLDNSKLLSIRNSSIGTLLTDLSSGEELEIAVKKYEDKVSGSNYRRPTPLVTPRMLELASKEIDALGYRDSLSFGHASLEDINIKDILYIDRTQQKRLKGTENTPDILTSLIQETTETSSASLDLNTLPAVKISDFLKDILPKVEKLEIRFESRLQPNLFNLLKSKAPEDKHIFKWKNAFSWSYKGGYASSVKEKVKKAGGNVDGDITISLAWYDKDDLDLSLVPFGKNSFTRPTIDYHNRRPHGYKGGGLDVDMNARPPFTNAPVENISFQNIEDIPEGAYQIVVTNYYHRDTEARGFELHITNKVNGEHLELSYPANLPHKRNIAVAVMTVMPGGKVTFTDFNSNIKSSAIISHEETWGIKQGVFHPVSLFMLSPNYWAESAEEGHGQGLKHYLFCINNCVNPEAARGMYNEYLLSELGKHRKVFELIGSRSLAAPDGPQLAGLGFAEGNPTYAVIRVTIAGNKKIYKLVIQPEQI